MQYTNQSAFDHVAAHLFNQGVRAMNEMTQGCKYKSNGYKCAIGCLLTDEECKHMDGHDEGDIATLMSLLPDEDDIFSVDIRNKLGTIDTGLMVDLQTVHDVSDNWGYTKDMREALRSIGYAHGLDVSCLEGMHFGDR